MTVRGEVPAGRRFSACVQFHNLSDEELGALLWLLTLAEGAYYSLGSGKPFGFGSIRISLASLNAWRGQALKARYASLLDPDKAEPVKNDQVWFEYTELAQSNEVIESLKKKFEDALEAAYGENKQKRLLKIFKSHRYGPPNESNLPVHYPRRNEAPDVEHGFKWFADNEKPNAWLSPGVEWDKFALPYRPLNSNQ